jgi:hypothetical protein
MLLVSRFRLANDVSIRMLLPMAPRAQQGGRISIHGNVERRLNPEQIPELGKGYLQNPQDDAEMTVDLVLPWTLPPSAALRWLLLLLRLL